MPSSNYFQFAIAIKPTKDANEEVYPMSSEHSVPIVKHSAGNPYLDKKCISLAFSHTWKPKPPFPPRVHIFHNWVVHKTMSIEIRRKRQCYITKKVDWASKLRMMKRPFLTDVA
jgi:hypothetical protein